MLGQMHRLRQILGLRLMLRLGLKLEQALEREEGWLHGWG